MSPLSIINSLIETLTRNEQIVSWGVINVDSCVGVVPNEVGHIAMTMPACKDPTVWIKIASICIEFRTERNASLPTNNKTSPVSAIDWPVIPFQSPIAAYSVSRWTHSVDLLVYMCHVSWPSRRYQCSSCRLTRSFPSGATSSCAPDICLYRICSSYLSLSVSLSFLIVNVVSIPDILILICYFLPKSMDLWIGTCCRQCSCLCNALAPNNTMPGSLYCFALYCVNSSIIIHIYILI